jgi:hypothetical protein
MKPFLKGRGRGDAVTVPGAAPGLTAHICWRFSTGIPDAPHCSVWLFLVYERVAFIGFTGRREDFP